MPCREWFAAQSRRLPRRGAPARGHRPGQRRGRVGPGLARRGRRRRARVMGLDHFGASAHYRALYDSTDSPRSGSPRPPAPPSPGYAPATGGPHDEGRPPRIQEHHQPGTAPRRGRRRPLHPPRPAGQRRHRRLPRRAHRTGRTDHHATSRTAPWDVARHRPRPGTAAGTSGAPTPAPPPASCRRSRRAGSRPLHLRRQRPTTGPPAAPARRRPAPSSAPKVTLAPGGWTAADRRRAPVRTAGELSSTAPSAASTSAGCCSPRRCCAPR